MAQVERLDDASRTEFKVLLHQFQQMCIIDLAGAKGIDHNADRTGNADRIAQLHFTLIGQASSHNVFRDITAGIGGTAVYLCGVLTGECTTSMTGITAIGIHNNLTSGQASIPLRTANNEFARGVNQEARVLIRLDIDI